MNYYKFYDIVERIKFYVVLGEIIEDTTALSCKEFNTRKEAEDFAKAWKAGVEVSDG